MALDALGGIACVYNVNRYQLLSLQPYIGLRRPDDDRPDYHGHEILGRVTITDAAVRARLNHALELGVRQSDGKAMACFNPRHGIRVIKAGVITDFVICFECRQVEVWQAGQPITSFLMSDSPQSVFDEILSSAGVPLAPKGP